MKIVRAEHHVLHIPFYADHVVRAMHRAQTHDETVHVNRIELDDGSVGYGDGGGAGPRPGGPQPPRGPPRRRHRLR